MNLKQTILSPAKSSFLISSLLINLFPLGLATTSPSEPLSMNCQALETPGLGFSATHRLHVKKTPFLSRFYQQWLCTAPTPMNTLQEVAANDQTATVFGEHLFNNIDNPEIVFRAWLRHTDHYRAPSGSAVHGIENDAVMGRIAAFFTGNMMLAIIREREKKYGTGWVSIVRNYGSTVRNELDVWLNDAAFAHFPWARVIVMGGDNVIHGLDQQAAAQTKGPADELFVPLIDKLMQRGLKKSMLIDGQFHTREAVLEFILPLHVKRIIRQWSEQQWSAEDRAKMSPIKKALLQLTEFRISRHIEEYHQFLPRSIRELVGDSVILDERDQRLDLMHMGLAQGPAEKPYYALVALAERYPWLWPLTGRAAGLLASAHIWFDERIFSSLISGMRVVFLDPITIFVNRFKYGQSENFWWAITLGLAETRDWARYNFVFVNKKKGTIAHMSLFGIVTRMVPASIHRLLGSKTVFFISKEAHMRFHTRVAA